MFEGTGNYFFLLFLILLLVYITIKICLGKLFKGEKIPAWKAYVPFYNRLVLINLLDLKKDLFYKTLIPIVNLYYYNIIIAELLKAYKLNPKESIWFILIPMYKFPELVFKKPKFMLHMYDQTEEFINNQNILFDVDNNVFDKESITINPENYNQLETPQEQKPNNYQAENVFSNQYLEPDERKETYIEAKQEEEKEEKPIIIDHSKPKVCPNCGTKLSPTATTCFLCGTKVL